MELTLLTLNLHTYQQHSRHCAFETMHHHEREVQIIAEAIAHLRIDVICFQEVGEYLHDPITHPYGESPSNMAFRICKKLRHWGHWFHIHQDWSHIGFYRWREGTAIMSRYPMRHNYSAYVSNDHRKDNYMSRNVTVSCIDVPRFGLLHVANVHLSWAHHGFFDEYHRLKKLIDSRRHFGVRADLIVGDFNAPAGEHAYNRIVGNAEYVDQFHELHPHRFYEPSYRGQIDGWKNSPPNASTMSLNTIGIRCRSGQWISFSMMIFIRLFLITLGIWLNFKCFDNAECCLSVIAETARNIPFVPCKLNRS